jgi:hypothetical protein
MLPPGVSSDLGCGDLGGWTSQDVAEDIVGFEGRSATPIQLRLSKGTLSNRL